MFLSARNTPRTRNPPPPTAAHGAAVRQPPKIFRGGAIRFHLFSRRTGLLASAIDQYTTARMTLQSFWNEALRGVPVLRLRCAVRVALPGVPPRTTPIDVAADGRPGRAHVATVTAAATRRHARDGHETTFFRTDIAAPVLGLSRQASHIPQQFQRRTTVCARS
jgi:hypothetical protein